MEQHARAVSEELARDKSQDVSSYVRQLQSVLHLDKRTCDKYIHAYQRARWTGPIRSSLSLADYLQFSVHYRDMVGQIDRAGA